ncbi:GIY-YIG nuclease family protein [Mucilaginibacter robiniae]|uniref:GIY-YIG nuclease family protein n=1 Tax=Mucilaginibacter robiniae TaxID=2728022 RepID=A0A7L5E690_9SPHI|nr:GIY-YIG nuclease family protein [Mucilaginibacter robiniae]QJD98148.1 GIY-YIG nuclease family protein [Mucilaginibacter robiniae]
MKQFVYIITDRNRSNLHVGLCSDMVKTINFYREMPTLFFDQAQQLSRLVYFEEINSEEDAMERFKFVSAFTRSQKEKMIRSVNPNWLDLTTNLNIEQSVRKRPYMRPAMNAAANRLTF